jgi:hypothetical protein
VRIRSAVTKSWQREKQESAAVPAGFGRKKKRPDNGQNKIVMAALQKGMPESICTNDGEVLILSFVLLRVKRKEGRE